MQEEAIKISTTCPGCGGEIIFDDSGTSGKCKYCNNIYQFRLPVTNEMFVKYQIALDQQENHEFAKAKRSFVALTDERPDFQLAWWGAFLSEYGIEFGVNRDGEKVPTCHRVHTESVFDNAHYKKAIETTTDVNTKKYYQEVGAKIESVRKQILKQVKGNTEYDIFICFKKTELSDESKNTRDYDLGQSLYRRLTDKGYTVFFSPETLPNIAEQNYEPYIFRALTTAKVMLLLCSDIEEIESKWVRNEWDRYLEFRNGQGLIPICGNSVEKFSPSQLPHELQHLNAIVHDENLIEAVLSKVKAIVGDKKKKENLPVATTDEEKQEKIKAMYFHLQYGEFSKATKVANQIVKIDMYCADAYIGKLMANHKILTTSEIYKAPIYLDEDTNFLKAWDNANDATKRLLKDQIELNYIELGEDIESIPQVYRKAHVGKKVGKGAVVVGKGVGYVLVAIGMGIWWVVKNIGIGLGWVFSKIFEGIGALFSAIGNLFTGGGGGELGFFGKLLATIFAIPLAFSGFSLFMITTENFGYDPQTFIPGTVLMLFGIYLFISLFVKYVKYIWTTAEGGIFTLILVLLNILGGFAVGAYFFYLVPQIEMLFL